MKKLKVRCVVERNKHLFWLEELGLEELYDQQIVCTLEIDDKLAEHMSPNGTSKITGRHLHKLIDFALKHASKDGVLRGYSKTGAYNTPWPLPNEEGEWPEYVEEEGQ